MFGARKRKHKKSKRKGCHVGLIRFKTKRGKVVSFKGKKGPSCGPRKKPSTRHLAKYKQALAKASRSCKGKHGKKFRKCVSARM